MTADMLIWGCLMKLNRKGYMLVEIIIASALAFGMAFFMINMTIRLKNKNDDMLVETLVSTDKAIIMNSIMRSVKGKACDEIRDNELIRFDDNKVYVNGEVATVMDRYAKILNAEHIECYTTPGENFDTVRLNIQIEVPQIPDKNFDVELYWIVDE